MVQCLLLWANLCACKIKLSQPFEKGCETRKSYRSSAKLRLSLSEKWGSCCVTRNFYKKKFLRDGCPVPPGKTFRRMVLRQISQGMVSGGFPKRQVSLTHPLLPAEEERRTSPQKRQKTKKLPRKTLLQNGAGTYIIATDVRSAWRTSSGKHF